MSIDVKLNINLKLSELLDDYLMRTRTQIEVSTANSAAYRMREFIAAVGNIRTDQVTFGHCEKFTQYSIDRGLSPHSVNTNIKMVKRIFSLAVKRGQVEKNPFVGISLIKVPRKQVRLLSEAEFHRLMQNTRDLLWKARLMLGKTAGLRRGEVLNLTVQDIDFEKGKIIVQPKQDSGQTWRWVVKDKDRREVPLVEELASLLTQIQLTLPEGQPYLMLTAQRYQNVMDLKRSGILIDRVCKCPDSNFRRNFLVICKRAGLDDVSFHDLRSTCITEWMEQGIMPHEVQRLAGHSSIETTMNYYVGIRESMLQRARQASRAALGADFGAHLARAPENDPKSTKKSGTGMLATS